MRETNFSTLPTYPVSSRAVNVRVRLGSSTLRNLCALRASAVRFSRAGIHRRGAKNAESNAESISLRDGYLNERQSSFPHDTFDLESRQQDQRNKKPDEDYPPGSIFCTALSATNQCSSFCMVTVIVGSLPAVRLYDTQYPAFGYRTNLYTEPSAFASASAPRTSFADGTPVAPFI